MTGINVKSFYSKKVTSYRLLADAIEDVKNDESEAADIIITGPPTGGADSDLEGDDDEYLAHHDLPTEVAGELEVITRVSELHAESEVEHGTDDNSVEEESSVAGPSTKRKKTNPNERKQTKQKPKPIWKKRGGLF